MSLGYIYKFTNNVNGKTYVGKSYDAVDRYHKHMYLVRSNSGYVLHKAMRKYGVESFSFELVFVVLDYDKDGSEFEMLFIEEFKSFGQGYNLTVGGEGVKGIKHSEETCQKNREAHTGARNPNYGKPRSEETKRKISEANKGRLRGPLPEETKVKMSEAHKGKKKSKDHCKSLRKAHGTKIEIGGTIYESLFEAEEKSGYSCYKIRKMIKKGTATVLRWGTNGGPNGAWFGKERPKASIEKTVAAQSKPIFVDGTLHKSFNSAWRTLGITSRTLYNLIAKGEAYYVDKNTGAKIETPPLKPKEPKKDGIPLIINGVPYESIAAAMRETGLPIYQIRKGLRLGTITYDTSVKSEEDIARRSGRIKKPN